MYKCTSIFTRLIFGWSFLFSLAACEEATEWDFQEGTNGVLVVDAVLTDEFAQQSIQLSLSYDGLNEAPPPVPDATVTVEVNGTTLVFNPDPNQAGWYRSELPFAVVDKLPYQLNIDWGGQRYQATSELSTVAPLPGMDFLPYKQTDSLFLSEFAPIYNANQQAMYQLEIDWSHLSLAGPSRAKLLYFTFSTLNSGALIRPAADTIAFPKGSRVVAKKFGLNDDFANYLRAMALETSWRGSVFYGPPANLPTNLSGGALGFFSTCAVLSDTLIAE